MTRRRSLWMAALTLWLPFAPAAAADGTNVVVAFRIDAAPFSARADDGVYSGFLASLCEAAVTGAGYTIAERVPITAADRFDHLDDGAVDLICDPTTLTRQRATAVDFSPIVFIANSGFLEAGTLAELTDDAVASAPDCVALRRLKPGHKLFGVGMVGETTASASFQLARGQGLLADTDAIGYCGIAYPTHDAGVDAICSGQVSYYFGDVDILRSQLARRKDCDVSLNGDFRAYEPYALAIPSHDPVFRRKFIAALYQLFAETTAQSAYVAAFGEVPMSSALDMLFRINNVPVGSAN